VITHTSFFSVSTSSIVYLMSAVSVTRLLERGKRYDRSRSKGSRNKTSFYERAKTLDKLRLAKKHEHVPEHILKVYQESWNQDVQKEAPSPEDEESAQEQAEEKETCKFFLQGKCTRGSLCQFGHPGEDTGPKLCRFFASGKGCALGDRCKFSHGEGSLKKNKSK